MKTITFIFVAAILVLSIRIWGLNQDTGLLNSRVKKAQEEIDAIALKEKSLADYKNDAPVPLVKFYLEVFNDIKEIASYYDEACDVKIVGGRDFTDTNEFFKASPFEGIRYADILCRFSLNEGRSVSLLRMFYGLSEAGPMEILEVDMEKNAVVLTMRLYGT